MKKKLLIIITILTYMISCENIKEDIVDPIEPIKGFDLTLDYDKRDYEFNQNIIATLKIKEFNASSEHFYLSFRSISGQATVTMDGKTIAADKSYTINYNDAAPAYSSKEVQFVITPVLSDATRQLLTLDFDVISANTLQTATQHFQVNAINLSEIHSSIRSISIEPADLTFDISASKEGYSGSFEALIKLEKGAGQFLYNNAVINIYQPIVIFSDRSNILRFTPSTPGIMKFSVTVNDGVISAQPVSIECDSYGGLLNPDNGVYIYANNLHYPLDKWSTTAAPDVAGISVIDDKCRFIIAKTNSGGKKWISPSRIEIPYLPYYSIETEACKDYDGKANTQAIVNALNSKLINSADAALFCYNYDKNNPGTWYLPAAGQINVICSNIDAIEKCLIKCGGEPFYPITGDVNYYFSSTGHSSDSAWSMNKNADKKIVFGWTRIDFGWSNSRAICDL